MKFINNWATTLTADLAALDDVLPIPPDAANKLDLSGVYWLTLADAEQSKWEIVEVSAGLAIQRGKDGAAPQDWPAGTAVYATVTAGHLTNILNRLAALEAGGGGTPAGGALADDSGSTLTDENSNTLIGG